MAEESSEKVQLHVYDLSQGLARQLSMPLMGKQIDGVWHTGVVVGGREFYFGGGIQEAPVGGSPFGTPQQVVDLGETHVPDDVRRAFIADLRSKYSELTYNLFTNNCNNFSDDLSQLLTGRGIPEYITGLPHEVLSTPFGQMIAPMLTNTIGERLGHIQQQPQATSHQTSAASSAPSLSTAADTAARQNQGLNSAGAVQAQEAPEAAVQGVADEIRVAAAVAAADTGIPVEAGGTSNTNSHQLGSRRSQEGVQELAKAHAQLSDDPTRAASLAQADQPAGVGSPARERPSATPTASTVPSRDSGSQPQSSKLEELGGRAAFEDKVKAEFARIMAGGGVSPNEAAALAFRRVTGLVDV